MVLDHEVRLGHTSVYLFCVAEVETETGFRKKIEPPFEVVAPFSERFSFVVILDTKELAESLPHLWGFDHIGVNDYGPLVLAGDFGEQADDFALLAG